MVADPKRAPVFALANHLSDAIDEVENTEARLERLDGVVEVLDHASLLEECFFLQVERQRSEAGRRNPVVGAPTTNEDARRSGQRTLSMRAWPT